MEGGTSCIVPSFRYAMREHGSEVFLSAELSVVSSNVAPLQALSVFRGPPELLRRVTLLLTAPVSSWSPARSSSLSRGGTKRNWGGDRVGSQCCCLDTTLARLEL